MGCIQCRKQKEQSTKSKSLDDTLSWLDSDCSIEDENILRMMDKELLLQNKNQEKNNVPLQPQQIFNQQIFDDVEVPQILQQHIREQKQYEFDDNVIQYDQNKINIRDQRRSKFDSKSLIEKRNEKSHVKLKKSRSNGELTDDLPPFNQILYQVFQEYNQQQKVGENNAIQTKIFSVQQQQKLMSRTNSNDDIFVDDNNSVESEALDIIPKCFCCNKQCNKTFQLSCLHFYNQQCLINLVVKQINQQQNILTCLCLKQIKNETITQIQSLAQTSHEEKEKIQQFYQNGY